MPHRCAPARSRPTRACWRRRLGVLCVAVLALGGLGARAHADTEAGRDPNQPQAPGRSSSQAVSLAIFDLFSVHHSDRGSEVHVLRIPFFQLFEWHDFGDDDFELQLVRAPFLTLFRRDRDFGYHKLEILDIPLLTFFNRWGDDEGRGETDFLGLPLIGSVYRSERTPTSTQRQILFLFRWDSS